jgi:hypothetical protein
MGLAFLSAKWISGFGLVGAIFNQRIMLNFRGGQTSLERQKVERMKRSGVGEVCFSSHFMSDFGFS